MKEGLSSKFPSSWNVMKWFITCFRHRVWTKSWGGHDETQQSTCYSLCLADGKFGCKIFSLWPWRFPSLTFDWLFLHNFESQIFNQTTMSEIGEKQFLLTGYLEYLLKKFFSENRNENHSSISNGYSNGGLTNGHTNGHTNGASNNKVITQQLPTVKIITPSDPKQRGSQLSLSFSVPLQLVQEELQKLGIVVSILNFLFWNYYSEFFVLNFS